MRPELVELLPDPAGSAEVVGREFRGHDVFYRVRLDGLELLSHRPSTEAVPAGQPRAREAARPVCRGLSSLCVRYPLHSTQGNPYEPGGFMTRIVAVAAGAVTALTLVGCGGGNRNVAHDLLGSRRTARQADHRPVREGDRHRGRRPLRRQRRARHHDHRGRRGSARRRLLGDRARARSGRLRARPSPALPAESLDRVPARLPRPRAAAGWARAPLARACLQHRRADARPAPEVHLRPHQRPLEGQGRCGADERVVPGVRRRDDIPPGERTAFGTGCEA